MLDEPLITNDAVNVGILMALLAFVFITAHSEHKCWKRFYSIIPSLLVCYFLPSVLTTLGVYDTRPIEPLLRCLALPTAC